MQLTAIFQTSTSVDNISTNSSQENYTGNSSSSQLSKSDYIYTILTAVTSGLSIIGGICICLLHCVFKDVRTPGRKLLLFLAISDAMLAFGNLLGVIWYLYSDTKAINKSPVYCKFQSALTIYFSNTAFSWTVVMGICLFVCTVQNNPSFTTTYMKLFHILAWIPPGIIVILALSMNVLGIDPTLNEASWCWIDPRVPNVFVWQMVTGKFWEIVAYITTVVLYGCIKCFLVKKADEHDKIITRRRSRKMIIREANRKLTFVPLVFIVCRIWGTLRFLLGNFAKDHINDSALTWINPLQGIGDSAQGFANFVLYCFSTEKIRHRLVAMVCPSSFAGFVTETGMASESRDVKRNKDGFALETETASQAGDIKKNKVGVAPEKEIESEFRGTKMNKIGAFLDRETVSQSGCEKMDKDRATTEAEMESHFSDVTKNENGVTAETAMDSPFRMAKENKVSVAMETEESQFSDVTKNGVGVTTEKKSQSVDITKSKVGKTNAPVFLPSISSKYEMV